jgi:DNA modification methylase
MQAEMTQNPFAKLRESVLTQEPVSGLTHCFYKYPARFSPRFVSTVLEQFSTEGDFVLDPYMGGGTTIVESLSKHRVPIGCDINSLAVFVATVKTTSLSSYEQQEIRIWLRDVVPKLSYHSPVPKEFSPEADPRIKNLSVPRARPVKKLLALAISELSQLPTESCRNFVRCVLLNVGQWALNGRKKTPTLSAFRTRILEQAAAMLCGISEFHRKIGPLEEGLKPRLIHCSAEEIARQQPFASGRKVDLVVTSPPYPGVHMLYHRWQVDGRKESPAPYWISNRLDGEGASYYNFGGRHQSSLDSYFAASLKTLKAVRSVMRNGAHFVQLIAFSDPLVQLPRYLENMSLAGFSEIRDAQNLAVRMWRGVPGRSWHANMKGRTHSSQEVMLAHTAI